jgi:hypothetical protein
MVENVECTKILVTIFSAGWKWGKYNQTYSLSKMLHVTCGTRIGISQALSVVFSHKQGRGIAQAVSRRLLTAAARVRAQVRSCGICCGQSGTGVGFLQELRFLLPILIPPTVPHSSSIIPGWYNRPISGRRTKWRLSLAPLQETERKLVIK